MSAAEFDRVAPRVRELPVPPRHTNNPCGVAPAHLARGEELYPEAEQYRKGDVVEGRHSGRSGVVEEDQDGGYVFVKWEGHLPVQRQVASVLRLVEPAPRPAADGAPAPDMVNHPPHYTSGARHSVCGEVVEVIDLTEGLGFCLGNVVKYVLRSPHKGAELADLRKARWYLDRHIAIREGQS